MLGAGTIINPITKVITTVAILAAVYFFILKPALESTERISSSVTESSQDIQRDVQQSIQDSLNLSNQAAGNQVKDAVKDAQQALNEAGINNGTPGAETGTALLDCINAANGNIEAIQACTN